MRFSYKKILVRDDHQKVHTAYRPLIPVEISVDQSGILTYGLIDSGADVCLFESALCQKLGLKLTTGKRQNLHGIGQDSITFYLHTVTLQVAGHSVKTEIGFSEETSHIPFAILGQKGFFENFLVAFHYPKKWIEVVRAKRLVR